MKQCSISYVIREWPIKTTKRCHHTPIRVARIQDSDDSKCWRGCGAEGTLVRHWGGGNVVTLAGSVTVSYRIKHTLNQTIQHVYSPGWNELNVYLHPHKNLHVNVYGSFSYHCQNLDATKIPSKRRAGKETVAHPDSAILFWAKKKWAMKSQTDQEDLKAYRSVKGADLKRPHTVWFQLPDMLEEAELWRQ